MILAGRIPVRLIFSHAPQDGLQIAQVSDFGVGGVLRGGRLYIAVNASRSAQADRGHTHLPGAVKVLCAVVSNIDRLRAGDSKPFKYGGEGAWAWLSCLAPQFIREDHGIETRRKT